MLDSGLRCVLIPAPLILAALALFEISPARMRLRRLLAAAAVLCSGGLLLSVAGVVGGGAAIEQSLGVAVPGVSFVVRGDSTGLMLAGLAICAALVMLIDTRRPVGEGALLVCLLGSEVAALAGNLVVLVCGLEVASVGTLLLFSRPRQRLGLVVIVATVIEQAAALLLLGAAVQVQAEVGSTSLASLPESAVGAAAGIPWVLAGAGRLLVTLVWPRRVAGWQTVVAIPAGAVVLLRLLDVTAGQLPTAVAVTAGLVGALALAVAAVSAWWQRERPDLCAQGLLAFLVALPLAGVALGEAGRSAAALALLSAEALCVPLAAMAAGRAHRIGAAVTMICATALPLGLAAPAVLALAGALATAGGAGPAMLLVIAGMAAALCIAAALTSARAAAITAWPAPAPWLAGVGVAAALLAGFLPGAVADRMVGALDPHPTVAMTDLATIGLAGGGWPQGYLLAAAALCGLAILAGRELLAAPGALLPGVRVPLAARHLPPLRHAQRRLRPLGARLLQSAGDLDGWLLVQPQLPLVVLLTAIALVVFR